MAHYPLPDKQGKLFWFLTRAWLKRVLLPALRSTRPIPSTQDFIAIQGVEGIQIALRDSSTYVPRIEPFHVELVFDDGDFTNTAKVSAGNLVSAGPSGSVSDQPLIHEPWIFPVDTFPALVEDVTLECAVCLKLQWLATREMEVADLTGIDVATKHDRTMMQWSLDAVDFEAVDVADFDPLLNAPVPSYAWDTNIATTYIELARVSEDPEAVGVPLIAQKVHDDVVANHPLTADLTTKADVAFPPDSPDGPSDIRPVIFLTGGTAQHEFVLNVDSAGASYCPEVRQQIAQTLLRKVTMVTAAGQVSVFHQWEQKPSTPFRHVAFLDECDPLA